MENDKCRICGCLIHHTKDVYAQDNKEGRSYRTKHHLIAKRFYDSKKRTPILTNANCPWKLDGKSEEFCYDCHEELLHNPVLLTSDIEGLAKLVRRRRGLTESRKTKSKDEIARRIILFHEVIHEGIKALLITEK